MVMFLGQFLRKDMVENVRTHGAEQLILGLEVGIKGASADVGFVNDLLHCDVFKALLLQQAAKGPEDRVPGFLLSSVHRIPSRTNQRKCSVSYIRSILIVVIGLCSDRI